MKIDVEVYGEGGFDPGASDGNVIERYEVEVDDQPAAQTRLDELRKKAEKAKLTPDEAAEAVTLLLKT